jgi:hypothetical protein
MLWVRRSRFQEYSNRSRWTCSIQSASFALPDGGVCDNQGLATLFEQDCKVILVSDASGQMESQPASSRGVLGVLLRTNDIFQARIREAQYTHLKGQHRSSLLRGFMFVHLKGDLDVDPVDWLECLDKYDASDDARPSSRRGPLTKYGIAKDIQRHLSALRTDLDSFSEAEAYALMTSGYCMTEHSSEWSIVSKVLSSRRRLKIGSFSKSNRT